MSVEPKQYAEKYQWLDACRARIDGFADKHFSLRGVAHVGRKSIRADWLRYPVNAMIAVPALSLRKAASWMEGLGWTMGHKLLSRIPTHFRTKTQKELEWLMNVELFGSQETLTEAERKIVDEEVRRYLEKRSFTAELATSLFAAGFGYLLLDEAIWSPGEIGSRLAYVFAKKQAVSNFFLGKTIGSAFYDIFPAAPSDNQVLAMTVAAIVLFGLLSFFVGFVCDPIQNKLGVHKQRLREMMDAIEARLLLASRQGR